VVVPTPAKHDTSLPSRRMQAGNRRPSAITIHEIPEGMRRWFAGIQSAMKDRPGSTASAGEFHPRRSARLRS
jgi:hypothetical protein